MTVSDIVGHLQMLPHPEGGYYRETYRAQEQAMFENMEGKRNLATAIYFLIEKNNFSALHKIKSDETWHFYDGDALEVIEITEEGEVIKTAIGRNLQQGEVYQYTVKAGRWFGSRVKEDGSYSLVGCTVAPGFDFRDFELAKQQTLCRQYPQHEELIQEMTRLLF
jgi:uncharacterized protein